MTHSAALFLFFLVVAGVVALPGVDMAYVLASTLLAGRRGGFAAIAGTVAGGICHTTMGALGIATILKVLPRAFNALLLIGSLYLAWIGWSLARSGISFAAEDAASVPVSTFTIFRRGALTNLLNPKAYLFMLAIFPQFVRAEYGPIWLQAVELGAITTVTQIAGYGLVTLAADGVRRWLGQSSTGQMMVARTVGGLLIVVAIATAIGGWRVR